ncbi:MAG: peptidase [Planctomycetaceae bacterium]
MQGVTRITPKYVTIEGITHQWKFGVATSSIPANELDAMIRNVTDQKKPADRMAIARFYIAAGMYPKADQELSDISQQFPSYQKKVQELRFQLRQLQGQEIVAELKRRKASGQHRLVYESCKKFPSKDISAALKLEVKRLKQDYENAAKQAENATVLLGELQSKLQDQKLVAAVAPLRSELRKQLNYDSLPRLSAFLNLAEDETLSPKEKLALAYSGWILGNENAKTNLDLTILLWNTRFLVSEYLRTVNSIKRRQIIEKIRAMEGVTPQMVGQMLSRLPNMIETPEVKPGVPLTVTVAGRKGREPIRYSVLLPSHYHPHRNYPMIVALHPSERTSLHELIWWGGNDPQNGMSHRHGYIVIAPEYLSEKKTGYSYNAFAHEAVIESIRDARKRFMVDSDRVFLSGHGSGGDAAFDIGMSHPDVFAGVIPINGISDKFCKWYYPNARHLPFYVVSGELARGALEQNGRELNRMMNNPEPYDVTYCEYIGRGYESYYEEIHQIFDWMSRLKRAKYLKNIDARILRPSDSRFYWVRASGFSRNVTHNTVLVEGIRKRGENPLTLDVRIKPNNNILIYRGAAEHTLWLSPAFIDFDQVVEVRRGSRRKFRGYVKRNLEVLLEDLRTRGDRQKPYWAKLEIGVTGTLSSLSSNR